MAKPKDGRGRNSRGSRKQTSRPKPKINPTIDKDGNETYHNYKGKSKTEPVEITWDAWINIGGKIHPVVYPGMPL